MVFSFRSADGPFYLPSALSSRAMDETTLRLLGVDRLREALAARCASASGRGEARRLAPLSTWEEAWAEAAAVDGLAAWRATGADLAIPDDAGVAAAVAEVGAGHDLVGEPLARLGGYLVGLGGLGRSLPDAGGWLPGGVATVAWGELDRLGREVGRTVDAEGRVREDATPELSRLHRRYKERRGAARSHAEALLHDPANEEAVAEAWVTVRGDRYVVPLRASQAGRLGGILHDRSKSGQTLFVEPHSLVDRNNQVAEAALAIGAEEQRLLAELNQRLRNLLAEVSAARAVATLLDRRRGAAALAAAVGGRLPEREREAHIDLRALRHPLLVLELGVEGVVANDLALGGETAAVVVSGANHGGKTALLQAAGLAVVMVRCGLLPPVGEGSRIGPVAGVFCHLGDHQEIATGHSSFSAQVARLAELTARPRPGWLVLLDEVGSHTEPQAGAALAVAAIEWVVDGGGVVVATTHLTPLKVLAESTPHMVNGHVLFDADRHAPTYRFVVGAPGGSETLTTARAFGLPEPLVARTEALMGGGAVAVERLWEELASREARLAAAEAKVAAAGDRLAAAEAALAARRRELQRAWGEEVAEKRRELARLMNETRRALKRQRRTAAPTPGGGIPGTPTAGTATAGVSGPGAVAAVRRRAEARLAALAPEEEAPPEEAPIDAATLRPGLPVRLRSLGVEGEVIGARRGRWQVAVAGRRLTVAADDLLPSRGRVREAPRVVLPPPPADLSTRLELIGLREGEARERLVRYLDGCVLADLATVEIVHGHGEGILKRMVAAVLTDHPAVASFHHPRPEEGGDGVTCVSFGGKG